MRLVWNAHHARGVSVCLLAMVLLIGLSVPIALADDHASTVANDVSEPGDYLTPEEVQEPLTVTDPSGRVTFTMRVSRDGSEHGTDKASLITEENGFLIGDEGPLDGVVSVQDTISYDLSYNVKPSATATPTTVYLVFDQHMEDRAGNALHGTVELKNVPDAPPTSRALDNLGDAVGRNGGLRQFCQGGQGYLHTGSMGGGFLGGPLNPNLVMCTLTFPATEGQVQESSTVNAGTFTTFGFSSTTDAFVTMGFAAFNDQPRTYDEAVDAMSYIPYRTRVVAADTPDLTLRRSTPQQVFIDGTGYLESTVEVFLIRSAPPNVIPRGLIGSARSNGSYAAGTYDPVYAYDTQGRLVFDDLPAGSVIVSGNPAMHVQGDQVDFQIPALTQVPRPNSLRPEVAYNVSMYPELSPYRVTVRVPLDALASIGRVDASMHLADVSMRRTINTAAATNLQLSQVMDDDLVYLSSTQQPGNNQPPDFDTGDAENLGGWASMRGQQSYPNNDWADLALAYETGSSGFFKHLVKDTSEKGDLSSLTLVESFMNTDLNPNRQMFDTEQWYAAFGTTPQNSDLTSTAYCDAWNPHQQRVDTSRPVRAFTATDGVQRPLPSAGFTVEYASSGAYEQVVGPVLGSGKRGPTDAQSRAAQLQACFHDDEITWSATPTSSTDLVRVRFTGTTDGRQSMSSSTRDWWSQALQVAYVPFIAVSGDREGYPAFPAATAVDDRMVVVNQGEDVPIQQRSRLWVKGTSVYIWPNIVGYSQNAGTTKAITLYPAFGSIWLEKTAPFDVTPSPDGRYRIKVTLPSAYADVQLDPPEGVTVVDRIAPDFGPDGLPGTPDEWGPDGKVGGGDDARGWVFVLDVPIMKIKNYQNWFTGTLPGYIPNGAQFEYSAELISDPSDLGIGDQVSVVDFKQPAKRSAFLTVGAVSSLSQTKFAKTQQALIGDDISWDVVWSNTFDQRSYGPGDFLDVLPYDGDARGTTLSAPLSDVRFQMIDGDDDVSILVTDADPSTITRRAVDDGTIRFVPLAEQDTLTGEITAYRIQEDTIEPKQIRRVRVTASVEGSADGDMVWNGLSEALVGGFTQEVPATTPVRIDLLDTLIDGTLWLDEDKDGVIDADEETRFPGATVSLVDGDGRVVASTTSDAQGRYAFATRPFSPDWTVRVTDRGAHLPGRLETTTPVVQDAPLTVAQPQALGRDFGFYETAHPAIDVVKTVRGHSPTEQIRNGTSLTWQFTVRNTGNVPVDGITLTDDVLGRIECPVDELAAGARMVCTVDAPIGVTD